MTLVGGKMVGVKMLSACLYVCLSECETGWWGKMVGVKMASARDLLAKEEVREVVRLHLTVVPVPCGLGHGWMWVCLWVGVYVCV